MLPSFSYFKYYIRSKMKERRPFKILCTIEYDVLDGQGRPVMSECSSCAFEVLKASLPISINKILQRTGHVQISPNHLKKSEKKDQIQTRTNYMMYLYVTSILKREPLLISHLSFKSGKHTNLKSHIQWDSKVSQEIALEYRESNPESDQPEQARSIRRISKRGLRELVFDEGVDLGFVFRIDSEQVKYNVGDISINFKREKFKFFSEIRIPNSLKVNARDMPFNFGIDYPDQVSLYQQFKVHVRVSNCLKHSAEFAITVSEK